MKSTLRLTYNFIQLYTFAQKCFVAYNKACDRLGLNGVRRVDGAQFCHQYSHDVAQETKIDLKHTTTHLLRQTRRDTGRDNTATQTDKYAYHYETL